MTPPQVATRPRIVTLGCRLNLAESERIAGLIAGADCTVVNTCAVTGQAVRDSRRALRRAREQRPGARIFATGCASEIDRPGFAALADAVVANARKLDPAAWEALLPPAPAHAPEARACGDNQARTRAFVPVQDGCDHACTFCIIPRGRGPSRSRPVAEVCEEIAALVAGGTREVVLTGVDLTAWGLDLPDAARLGSLVAAVLRASPALPRLRLSSLDPAEIDPELFDLLAGEPRVMPHLHLSLQSGDDLVLRRMKRRHRQADAARLVDRLRARRPQIAVGADLIAGFPTESEAMHGANLAAIDALDIVHGHVFPYSPRPGTPAARMPAVAPQRVRERAAELRERVAQRRRRWLAGLIGSRQEVLAERDGTGHTPAFARFRLPAATPPGALVMLEPARIAPDGLLAAALPAGAPA